MPSFGSTAEVISKSPRNGFEPVQYEIAASLVKLLMDNFKGINKQRVVGHCDVAAGRKTDPGDAFNWEYFYSLLD